MLLEVSLERKLCAKGLFALVNVTFKQLHLLLFCQAPSEALISLDLLERIIEALRIVTLVNSLRFCGLFWALFDLFLDDRRNS